jgi:hypothetical protein
VASGATSPRAGSLVAAVRLGATLAAVDAAQEVIQAAEARGSALADGDAQSLASLLHPNFRWTSYLGETYRHDEYIRRNTSLRGGPTGTSGGGDVSVPFRPLLATEMSLSSTG